MTVMGMAASQARFLGLTARKSNVEYQGQQINQQRTALANESANLYNQMMTLEVPVPPAQTDFSKTVFTLEDSKESYTKSDYQIANLSKTYSGVEGEYLVTLSTKEEIEKAEQREYKFNSGEKKDDVYTFYVKDEKLKTSRLTYDPNDLDAFTGVVANDNESDDDTQGTETGALNAVTGQIYALPMITNDDGTTSIDEDKCGVALAGYESCLAELRADKNDPNANFAYFYMDANDKIHFMTAGDLTELTSDVDNKTNNAILSSYNSYTYYKETNTQVTAILEESETGRYSSITIYDKDGEYPANLSGKTFTINQTQEVDEAAYKDAFNEYEYKKQLYEQEISDINSQTEVIQRKDQKLELRLDQLDTEQNAIKTEMDSVTKVIEDNIEKTFKTFA